MSQAELRQKAIMLTSDMIQRWMDFYEVVRKKGFSEEAAKKLVNAVTSPETMKMWLDVYELARQAGLSEQMAMQYANTAIPSIKDECIIIENAAELTTS